MNPLAAFLTTTFALLATSPAWGGEPLQWRRVYHSGEPLPGITPSAGSTIIPSVPGFDGSTTAFQARADLGVLDTELGIFVAPNGGSLQAAALRDQPSPPTVFPWTMQIFGPPNVDDGAIGFACIGSNNAGTLRWRLGTLEIIADQSTQEPSSGFRFTNLSDPMLQGGSASFGARIFAPPHPVRHGVYRHDAGVGLRRVVDTTFSMPGAGVPFTDFSQVRHDDAVTVFRGEATSVERTGVYSSRGGEPIHIVADSTMTIPGSDELFRGFSRVVVADGTVVFSVPVGDQAGFFAANPDGSSLRRLVGIHTINPETGKGIGELAGDPSFDDGRLLFVDQPLRNLFVFTEATREIRVLLSAGDTIDGRVVREIRNGWDALAGGRCAVLIRFTDSSRGIYTTTFAPPVGPCPGDTDGSRAVGFPDLNRVLGNFGAGTGGDTDEDGDTDFADLNIVLGNFGDVCP